jgi:hypothetical protein
MSYPTIDIDQKKIILLSGFERACGANKPFSITAKEQLEEAAKAAPRCSRLWLRLGLLPTA